MKRYAHIITLLFLVSNNCFRLPVFGQAIAGGWAHSLFICSDSTVKSTGYNGSGQLGNGTTTDSNMPVSVNLLTGVIDVAAGANHSLALKDDSTVWAFGGNSNGQLGNGTNINSSIPVLVSTLTGIIEVEGGVHHSMALKSDSTVWTWGLNTYGELGNGTTVNSNVPIQVNLLSGVVAIAGGTWHSLALRSDSTVWTWGNNQNGELGDGTNITSGTPVQVVNLTGVIAVAGGQHFSAALKGDGTVWTWGYNAFYQLGNGTSNSSNIPIQVNLVSGITAISKGGYQLHMAVLKNDSTVWTWGWNDYGELGNGTITPSSTPFQMTGINNVAAIAVGNVHTVALKKDGTIWDWGWNLYGTLGNGMNTDVLTPILPPGLCTGPIGMPSASFIAFQFLCPGTCTEFINASTNATSYQWIFPGASPSSSTDENPVNICYNTPGSYDVTLIASNSFGSDTFMITNAITVYPYSPSQSILQYDDTLFSNTGFLSYQWFFSGDTIPGATDYYYVAMQSGDYSVICLDGNGCSVEAVLLNVVAGIQYAFDHHQPVIVYPNPVAEELGVRNWDPDSYRDGVATNAISIYNVIGDEIPAVELRTRSPELVEGTNSEQRTINVSHLSSGVYFLELKDGKTRLFVRFIKN